MKCPGYGDKVNYVRLQLIYADSLHDMGDDYKKSLFERKRSEYKQFCTGNSIFFMEYDYDEDEEVRRLMPKRRASS